MTEKKLYLIIQSVLCVLMVILLVASAISIYCEGMALRAEDPMASIYTREKVAEKLRSIFPLFFASIGLPIADLVLAVKDDNADKPVKDAEINRNLTVVRVVQPGDAIIAERSKQKKLFWTGWVLFLLCMFPIGIYLLNGVHFPDGDLEVMIASLVMYVFPWIVLGLGCLCISSVLQEKSTDPLTGVQSRYAYSRMLKGYDVSGGLPDGFAAFTIDINGLKRVNDTLGHEAGDELICGAADCIMKAFPTGACFRTGGDEFVVLTDEMNRVRTEVAMSRLKREVSKWDGKLIHTLELAAGYAIAEENPGLSAEKLVHEADMAMYEAKAAYYRKKGNDRRRRR